MRIIGIFVPSGSILYLCFDMFLSKDQNAWNITAMLVQLASISLLMIVLSFVVML